MDSVLVESTARSLDACSRVAQEIAETLDRLDLVVKQEFASVGAFKNSIVGFAGDLMIVTENLKTVTTSDNADLANVLVDNESSTMSLQMLLAALQKANALLRRRLPDFVLLTSDIHATIRAKSYAPSPSQILKFAPIRAFESVLGTDIVVLGLIRRDVIKRSSDVIEAFQLHDTFKRCFFDRPFHFLIGGLYGLYLQRTRDTLRFDRTWVDRYASAVQGTARTWINHNLDDLTVSELGQVQISLLQNLSIAIDRELFVFKSGHPDRVQLLTDIKAIIQKEVIREKNQKFTIAFCGMVKAGKSLFLNALTGISILPSDELPSTAWPCRLQHVEGLEIPHLEVDASYFQPAIESLKKHKYGAMMVDFMPRGTDPFSDLYGNEDAEETFADAVSSSNLDDLNLKQEVYRNWVDLHPTTKANLLRFEQSDYQLPAEVDGEESVSNLLAQINDIVRLSRRLKVPLPTAKPVSWPLLKVQFESLKGKNVRGVFEFIDLPGVGESSYGDYHTFEDLVRLVAKEANAVVPIVSLKEVSKDDWKQQLPDIIKTGLGRAPELVLCTHLDQIAKDRLDQQIESVAKVFWPKSINAIHRVLCCSSRMGISARTLLGQSALGKPQFVDIWSEDQVVYDCAEKILGIGNPEQKLDILQSDEWIEAIVEQLTESRLEPAVTRLTTDIVTKERGQVMRINGEQIRRKINKAWLDQQRLLVEMRRSPKEFQNAYNEFKKIRSQFTLVLGTWNADQARMSERSQDSLREAMSFLEQESLDAVAQAVEATACESSWRNKIESLEDFDLLMFRRKTDAEFFILSIQLEMQRSLGSIKRRFVGFVRQLANRLREEHFDSLKNQIQATINFEAPNALLEEIQYTLNTYGRDINSMVLPSISKKVVHTVTAKRHSLASAYHAIQNVIARPLLHPTSKARSSEVVDPGGHNSAMSETSSNMSSFDSSEHTRDVDQLGFMLRAPVAVLAIVPWLLGSGLWPFMARSKGYVLRKRDLSSELQDKAVRPYLRRLEDESKYTLNGIRIRSSELAYRAVEVALEEEQRRFNQEEKEKRQPRSKVVAVSSLTILLNLLAADAGLLHIQHLLNAALSR